MIRKIVHFARLMPLRVGLAHGRGSSPPLREVL